jgi:hypothetical protein
LSLSDRVGIYDEWSLLYSGSSLDSRSATRKEDRRYEKNCDREFHRVTYIIESGLVGDITFCLEEVDEVTHILSLDESDEFAIFGHRHECISLSDAEHITDILRDDDLTLGSDGD